MNFLIVHVFIKLEKWWGRLARRDFELYPLLTMVVLGEDNLCLSKEFDYYYELNCILERIKYDLT